MTLPSAVIQDLIRDPYQRQIHPLISGHAAIRSSTTDYMPIVGPVADYAQFMQIYAKLAQDSKYRINTPCPYLPGLFINAAHGAKGMLSAPLCGEIIANYIDNQPQQLSTSVIHALHPNRLYFKQLIQKNNL